MLKHFIGIGILSILVFFTLGIGFSMVGSPLTQRGLKFDEQRIQDFYGIKSSIQKYYSDNDSLPQSLSEVEIPNYYKEEGREITKDPETKKDYQYEVVSETSYQLCTTFSIDSAKAESIKRNNFGQYNYVNEYKHTKGYDCIKFDLPNYKQGLNLNSDNVANDNKTSCTKKGGTWNQICHYNVCSDSDSGDNAYIRGEMSYGNGSIKNTATDKCNNNILTERLCVLQSDNSYLVSQREYTCPKGCSEGACL